MIRSRLPLFLGCATLAFSLATVLPSPARAEDATPSSPRPNAMRPMMMSPEQQKMREDMLKLNNDTLALIDKCIPTKSETVTGCLQEKKALADRRADLTAKRTALREKMMATHKEYMKGMRKPMMGREAPADMLPTNDAPQD